MWPGHQPRNNWPWPHDYNLCLGLRVGLDLGFGLGLGLGLASLACFGLVATVLGLVTVALASA